MNIHLPQLDSREAAREKECPHRFQGQCIEIARRVGWDVAVSIDWCDSCFVSGRPASGLETLANAVVRSYLEPKARKLADREVLESLRDKHGVMIEPEEIARASDRKQRWKDVKATWQTAASFTASALSRLVLGPVSERRMQARMDACARCPAVRESGGRRFCGVCGCGDTSLAALDDKLKHPLLRCPMGRFT